MTKELICERRYDAGKVYETKHDGYLSKSKDSVKSRANHKLNDLCSQDDYSDKYGRISGTDVGYGSTRSTVSFSHNNRYYVRCKYDLPPTGDINASCCLTDDADTGTLEYDRCYNEGCSNSDYCQNNRTTLENIKSYCGRETTPKECTNFIHDALNATETQPYSKRLESIMSTCSSANSFGRHTDFCHTICTDHNLKTKYPDIFERTCEKGYKDWCKYKKNDPYCDCVNKGEAEGNEVIALFPETKSTIEDPRCLSTSCNNPDNYDTLNWRPGAPGGCPDVLQICNQKIDLTDADITAKKVAIRALCNQSANSDSPEDTSTPGTPGTPGTQKEKELAALIIAIILVIIAIIISM